MNSGKLSFLRNYHPYVIEVSSEFVSNGDLEVYNVDTNYNYNIPDHCSTRLKLRTLYNVCGNSCRYRLLDRPREPTAYGSLNKSYQLLFCKKLYLVKKIKRCYKRRKFLELSNKKICKDLALLIVKYF